MRNKSLSDTFGSLIFTFFVTSVCLFAPVSHRVFAQAPITVADIQNLWEELKPLADQFGAATPELQKKILAYERANRNYFDEKAAQRFQTMVATFGAVMLAPAKLPETVKSYFQLEKNPLANFQSQQNLPSQVMDYVVVGLGLAGGQALYELAQTEKNVLALDFGNPAEQASGLNGGNFQSSPENFKKIYEGLFREREKYLTENYRHSKLSASEIKSRALREAEEIMKIGINNAHILNETVKKEKIDVDLSTEGWLKVASDEAEEVAIKRDIELAQKLEIPMIQLTPDEIFHRFGIKTKFIGRLAPGFGNYHPRKYVVGIVKSAIDRGAQVFTQAKVTSVDYSNREYVIIHTNRGSLKTKKAIFATNAFTAEIFPQLDWIKPYVSQIFDINHVESDLINKESGLSVTFTTKYGDLYLNIPAATIYKNIDGKFKGMAHIGGGEDRPISNPYNPPLSQEVFEKVLNEVYELYPELKGRPPVRINVGPMAFTPDRKIALGFLAGSDQRVIIAAGFNGYGGTWAIWAGKVAAKIASTGYRLKSFIAKMFSPNRMKSTSKNTCAGSF